MRGWRPINLEFRLTTNLIYRSLIRELRHKLISLYVNVLLAWWSLGCFDITSEKLFGSFRSLLLQTLRVIFALIGLEELIGVSASGDHHSGIGTSTENTFIKHDILRVVLLGAGSSVWVLILLFLCDNTRMSCKALSTCSAT